MAAESPDLLETASRIISSIAAIIVSVAAVCGVTSWWREFRGKRRAELAEEVLAIFYQVRDAIRYMRNPTGYLGEGESRKSRENETEKEKEAGDRAHVMFVRYDHHSELFAKLRTTRYRFMAQLGNKAGEPFDDMEHILTKLLVAARMLATLWAETRVYTSCDSRRVQKHHESVKKYEAVFYGTFCDQDEIHSRLEAAVSAMEETCRPIISRKTLVKNLSTAASNAVQRLWGSLCRILKWLWNSCIGKQS